MSVQGGIINHTEEKGCNFMRLGVYLEMNGWRLERLGGVVGNGWMGRTIRVSVKIKAFR